MSRKVTGDNMEIITIAVLTSKEMSNNISRHNYNSLHRKKKKANFELYFEVEVGQVETRVKLFPGRGD